jgi:RimJ/RimL family protein N-acetyltransferase
MTISLRTPRLLLREWEDADRAPFAAMSADPRVMKFLAPFSNPAAIDEWVARARSHWVEHGFGKFVVEVPGEADFIGVVGLDHVSFDLPFSPAIEVLWRLARPYWGCGYAAEAARAVIDDGFGRLGLSEIVAYTVVANRRSRRLMERLGMTRNSSEDFDFRHPRRPEGYPPRTHVLYRLRRA